MEDDTLGAYNIADLREMARRRLPTGMFEFVDRGTEDDVALADNRRAFGRIKFKPRTLVDVSGRSQEITLFGKKQPLPIAIAPAGGEAGAARAIAILREEIDRVMALIGARGIADLSRDYLQINDAAAWRGGVAARARRAQGAGREPAPGVIRG